MQDEPAATSNSLSGADGTQLPDPWPVFSDPLAAPEPIIRPVTMNLPPVPSPPVPDERTMRAAMSTLFDPVDPAPAGAATAAGPAAVPAPAPAPREPVHRPPPPAGDRFSPVPRHGHPGKARTGCVGAVLIVAAVSIGVFGGVAGMLRALSGLFR
jgi:hypothetical protein